LQKICDGLSAEKIDGFLRKWLRLLPHPFTGADRKAGYRYDISILQAEFSLTQVLDRPWLLDVERLSHDCMLTEDTFQTINGPVAAGRQRASGLRFADRRIQSLLHGLIPFRLLPNGFRCADLRHHLAVLSGCDPQSISRGAITYQLRRLRLHGLIERVPDSFRYRVTEFGLRVALFFTRTYNRILRPGLAAALPTLRAINAPLKRAFDAACTTNRPSGGSMWPQLPASSIGAESKLGHRGTYLRYRPATVKGHITRKERTSSAIASSFSKTEARIRRFRHSR
jgi:hypothetical protein